MKHRLYHGPLPVLVGVRDVAEAGEPFEFSPVLIQSLAWLAPLNLCDIVRVESREIGSIDDMSSPAIVRTLYRKLRSVLLRSPSEQCKIEDEVIERRSEVVDSLADEDTEQRRHLDECIGFIQRQLVSLRVETKENTLLAHLPAELHDTTLKIIEMAVCPLYPVIRHGEIGV
ncbi:MAG: hypothetical protein WAR24_02415 [Candidatus Acidiferrales bacterium]